MKNYKNFDWSELNRQTLFDIVYLLKDKIVNNELTVDQFHSKVCYQIKKFIPVTSNKVKDSKVELGMVYVGGTYYGSYDQEKRKCIELVLAYNDSTNVVNMTRKKFLRFCIGVADTILHEVIHMRQYRRRGWKIIPDYSSNANKTKQREEQEYLGCKDEIDAYSFNIACELMDKFNFDEQKVINYINENQKGKNRVHNSYRMYLKAFGHDHNHPIIKQVKKKVVYYLPKAVLGKPFNNSNWIFY